MSIEERVKEIIGGVLNTPPELIRLEASLKDDLGASSLDRYTILMEIEDAYSLELDEIPEEELEDRIACVGDIVAFLRQRVEAG